MSNPTKLQYAAVEYPFPQADLPVIHCPVCGQGTHDIHEDGSSDLTPCPHLSFIFIGEPSIFAYKSHQFEQRVSNKRINGFSTENFQKFLKTLGYDNKMLALEVTHGGLGGHGLPIWYVDIYGFDYSVRV